MQVSRDRHGTQRDSNRFSVYAESQEEFDSCIAAIKAAYVQLAELQSSALTVRVRVR